MIQQNNSVTSAGTKDDSSNTVEQHSSSPNNAKPNVGGSFCPQDTTQKIKNIEQIMRFRAWDKTNNKWAYVGFHLFGEVTIFGLLEQYKFEDACKDLEFTQFVNLQDKCKEDLYVGDLFKCETDDMIYRIFAVDGGFAINTHVQRWQKDIKDDYPFPLIPLSDEQTVSWIKGSCLKIGNIYENPEIIRGVS
jgi:hypothetical protein